MHERSSGDGEQLLKRAQAGDREALGSLLRRERPALVAAAYRWIGSRDEVDDAVQETLARALTRLEQVADAARLSAWLRAILRNVCRERARRAYRQQEVGWEGAPEIPSRPASVEDRLWIEEILDSLPTRHERVLRDFYLRGLTAREIGDELGRPLGTIKRWLGEGRELARRQVMAMTAEPGVVFVVGELSHGLREQIKEAASKLEWEPRFIAEFRAGWEAMREARPEMAILAMPEEGDAGGLGLLGIMKHAPEHNLQDVPVILIGPSDEFVTYAAWATGADCYLTPPVNPEELAEFMRRLGAQTELSLLRYSVSEDLCDPTYRDVLSVEIQEVLGSSPTVSPGEKYLVRGTYELTKPCVSGLFIACHGRSRGRRGDELPVGSGCFEATAEILEVTEGRERQLDLMMADEKREELGVRVRIALEA